MSHDPLRDLRSVSKKLVVMLVIIAIFGTVVGLSINSGFIRNWEFERRAASWTPGPEDSLRPAENLIAPDMDIVGDWLDSGMSYVRLSIAPPSGDTYRVEVQTGGCLGSASLERTATFRNGEIKLNKPIAEYDPVVYDTIYAVRIGAYDCLVPAAKIKFFNELMEDEQDGANYAPFCALTRDEDN